MKRDDIIAGIIGGMIFVTGCTVGIFGYKKMNEPLFRQEFVEKGNNTVSYKNSFDYSNSIDEYETDGIETDVITNDDSGDNRSVEELVSDFIVDGEIEAQPRDEQDETHVNQQPPKIDSDVIAQVSDNSDYAVSVSGDETRSENYFNIYDIPEQQNTSETYVLNTGTFKIHHPDCDDVKKIKPENYATSSSSIDELISQGYTTCGHCFR